jgi:hypothetical protein
LTLNAKILAAVAGRPFIVGLPAAVGAMKTGDNVNLAEVRVSYSPAVAWV